MVASKAPTPEDLSAQIDQLKADISGLTETITLLGKAKGEAVKDSVRSRADAARVGTEAQLAELQRQALSGYDDAEDYVRRNPATSLGIAAGIGLLIGLMTARR